MKTTYAVIPGQARNPAQKIIRAAGNIYICPAMREPFNQLDFRLRGNDGVLA